MILIFLTLITALALSAVAAFYSIVGLTTIFAASILPVIIMASILEVGKLVTTVWLHENWHRVRFFMRVYLCIAVVILMIITSMGIFGFLSKAHIEQASNAAQGQAQIERVVSEIELQENVIVRANNQIEKLEGQSTNTNISIQEQIADEQARIDTQYSRIQPAIDEQNNIIADTRVGDLARTNPYEQQLVSLSDELKTFNEQIQTYESSLKEVGKDTASIDASVKPYEDTLNSTADDAIRPYVDQIASINRDIESLQNLTASGNREDIKRAQQLVGISADGIFGTGSARATDEWKDKQAQRIAELSATITDLRQQHQSKIAQASSTITQLRKEFEDGVRNERSRITGLINDIQNVQIPALKTRELEVLATIDNVRSTESPIIIQAREEIVRIRYAANQNIEASQKIIEQLRDKIQIGSTAEQDELIDAQRLRITTANTLVEQLTDEKFALETEARAFEAEVGPVKYIAALIYEDGGTTESLEDAVRWVIIMLVFVFDPLAIMLLLAATETISWRRKEKQQQLVDTPLETKLESKEEIVFEDVDQDTLAKEAANEAQLIEDDIAEEKKREQARAQAIIDNPGYPPKEKDNDDVPQVHVSRNDDPVPFTETTGREPDGEGEIDGTVVEPTDSNIQDGDVELDERDREADDAEGLSGRSDVEPAEEQVPDSDQTEERTSTEQDTGGSATASEQVEGDITEEKDWETLANEAEAIEGSNNVLKQAKQLWKQDNPAETLKFERIKFMQGLITDLPWMEYIDDPRINREVKYGSEYPADALRGDLFINTKQIPSSLHKFNGEKWISVNKLTTDQYAYNSQYIQYLIGQISAGVYDPELLTDSERSMIETQLQKDM